MNAETRASVRDGAAVVGVLVVTVGVFVVVGTTVEVVVVVGTIVVVVVVVVVGSTVVTVVVTTVVAGATVVTTGISQKKVLFKEHTSVFHKPKLILLGSLIMMTQSFESVGSADLQFTNVALLPS
jgi:uncharacterized membrane protein